MILLRSKNFGMLDFFKRKESKLVKNKDKKVYPNYSELRNKYKELKDLDTYEKNIDKYRLLSDEYYDAGGFINGDYSPMKFISDEDANWWGNSGIPSNYRPVLEGIDLHSMLSVDINTGKFYIVDPETGKSIYVPNVNQYKKMILGEMKRLSEDNELDMKKINNILKKY